MDGTTGAASVAPIFFAQKIWRKFHKAPPSGDLVHRGIALTDPFFVTPNSYPYFSIKPYKIAESGYCVVNGVDLWVFEGFNLWQF